MTVWYTCEAYKHTPPGKPLQQHTSRQYTHRQENSKINKRNSSTPLHWTKWSSNQAVGLVLLLMSSEYNKPNCTTPYCTVSKPQCHKDSTIEVWNTNEDQDSIDAVHNLQFRVCLLACLCKIWGGLGMTQWSWHTGCSFPHYESQTMPVLSTVE